MLSGRVLITGATGFVGRALAADLAGGGAGLTLAARDPGRLPPMGGATRLVTIAEIGPETDWTDALAGVEAVVHLAGIAHVPEARAGGEAAYDRVNHRGTARLVSAARAASVGRFVFLSSATVLGDGADGRVFDDDSPPEPRNAYARSKLAAERALGVSGEGPAVTILRPPLVCGPGAKGNLAALLRLLDSPWPLPLGAISNRRTLVGLDALCAAIAALLAAPVERVRGTFLVGDAAPLSTSDIAAALREGLGRPRRLVPAPQAAIRVAASLAGRPGIARRLLGDFALDASRFRDTFGIRDTATARASLVAAGQAWRGGASSAGKLDGRAVGGAS